MRFLNDTKECDEDVERAEEEKIPSSEDYLREIRDLLLEQKDAENREI